MHGISGVVPVYNGASYLAAALDSILGQTLPCNEIIVVDDGSTDGTAAVIAKYGASIRSTRQLNRGPAAARNAGARLAHGEYLAFLDADDLWDANKLAVQHALLENDPSLGGCVTMVQNFWVPELAEEERRFKNDPIARPLPGFVCQTLMVRRSVFDELGPLDETLGAADATDWFLRARARGVHIKLVEQVLVARRLHMTNRSRTLGALPHHALLASLRRSLSEQSGAK